MKLIVILIPLFLIIEKCDAQDYLISFAGTGDTSLVKTVRIDNLSSGQSVNINGTDLLHLSPSVGMDKNKLSDQSLRIHPNPFFERTYLTVTNPAAGNVVFKLTSLSGKIIRQCSRFLPVGESVFCITGLKNGVYLLDVKGDSFISTTKLISCSALGDNADILYISSEDKSGNRQMKSNAGTVDMLYHTGDRLLFTGISGQYSTILTEIPTGNSAITFNFKACKDAEGNNYSTVKIGSQTWMAENLKTAKLNNGMLVQEIADSSSWVTSTAPALCWYGNNPANKDKYGALYNWFVVATDQLAPPGWHVPSNAEWTQLSNFLGGELITGGKLKETGTLHWQSTNVASNSSGFTGLPGGMRSLYFDGLGTWAYWWSSSAYLTFAQAYCRAVRNDYANLYNWTEPKGYGLSVRCIKDE